MKSEAGQSLAEVRKKIADCTKCLEKVGAIQELRGIRRQTALQRGICMFGKRCSDWQPYRKWLSLSRTFELCSVTHVLNTHKYVFLNIVQQQNISNDNKYEYMNSCRTLTLN